MIIQEGELCDERLDGFLPVEKVMLWSEQEAAVKQVTQIATSACGATAAINAIVSFQLLLCIIKFIYIFFYKIIS